MLLAELSVLAVASLPDTLAGDEGDGLTGERALLIAENMEEDDPEELRRRAPAPLLASALTLCAGDDNIDESRALPVGETEE